MPKIALSLIAHYASRLNEDLFTLRGAVQEMGIEIVRALPGVMPCNAAAHSVSPMHNGVILDFYQQYHPLEATGTKFYRILLTTPALLGRY